MPPNRNEKNDDAMMLLGKCLVSRADTFLSQVKGIIVVNGSPQKVPEVANLLTVSYGRSRNPGEFGECFAEKSGSNPLSSIALRAIL